MKNIINCILFVAVASVVTACSTANTANLPQVSRSDVSGTWVVNNVSLENFPSGYSVGNVFDLADYRDFEGSIWDLNGNGTGTITLNNGMVQDIYWSVNKSGPVNTFQFKKLEEGQRARDVTTGYSLEFGDFTSSTAGFRTPVNLSSGQTAYVNFNFSKR